ncbi:MAG: HDOD domain-containing protein [Verrucomicrobia bacterium]|nr:HDOD domain-containing protein [Verrucomicrobiota bacterium]
MPAAPQVMAGLCELLQDVNSDLDQVANQIRVDPALSARVIRISNSPAYGGSRIGSVDEAVNRVGFGEILRLVGIASVSGLVDRALTFYGIGAERMRESLLMHALASEALARRADVDPRTAYTGGILRTLGVMVLDRIARERKPAPEVYSPERFLSYPAWENFSFGVTNTGVTTTVLDEWRFPAELVAGLEAHLLIHDSDYDDRLAVVLNLGGAIVAEAGLALAGEASAWTPTDNKFSATGLDREQLREAGAEARTLFDRQRVAFA